MTAGRAALAAGARLAGEHGAALEIIAVAFYGYTELRWELMPGLAHTEGQRKQVLEERVEAAARALPPDLPVSRSIVPGDPFAVLSDRASELDLLAVGSRGQAPVAGVLLGSVSSELALAVPCPLLVVPRG
jgi:nucleotide-binding universal stress UspA family protein